MQVRFLSSPPNTCRVSGMDHGHVPHDPSSGLYGSVTVFSRLEDEGHQFPARVWFARNWGNKWAVEVPTRVGVLGKDGDIVTKYDEIPLESSAARFDTVDEAIEAAREHVDQVSAERVEQRAKRLAAP